MRTTLNLDSELMLDVKRRAAESGRTVTAMIELALRELLASEAVHPEKAFRLEWITVPGGVQPGVDLSDRDSLYDLMEGKQ